jgi:virulence factor Mce-like protein
MTTRSRSRRPNLTHRHTVLGLGAIVVVAIVGVIAYTANRGLPLQHRSHYIVEVPNAERLIDSADVRVGGIRVGQVLGVEGVAPRGRRPYARIELALEPSVKRIPVDSTVQVRPASVLGLTYVDLRPGRSPRSLPDRGTLPLDRARASSNLTDLFAVFDRRSARRFQSALADVSGGFTGRGTAMNATIHSLSAALPKLTSVGALLAEPRTRLPAFLRGYEATVAALAPVSDAFAGLISGGAATFDALAGERRALGSAIAQSPATETAVTQAFAAMRPGLADLSRLAADLRPGAGMLRPTLRRANTVLAAGVRPLRALPSLVPSLDRALVRLDQLSRDPNTGGSLRKLADLASAGRGTLSLLVPAQVHCNVVSLFTQGFAGTFGTLGTGDGPSLGALFLGTAGAQGEGLQNAKPSPNAGINPYPNENASECESGNEPWSGKQQLGNPPGLQSTDPRPAAAPPGVLDRAASAGLMTDPEGAPR